MTALFNKFSNTIQYHYYRRKNNWEFPANMVHTSGARVAKGTYEPELSECIRANIGKGSTVLDVGANIGYYARLFARMVEESGSVVAFEAESENYRCLCRNIAGFSQVTPVSLAVSNTNTFTELHRSSHSSCHSMYNTGNYLNDSRFRIPTMKLDLFRELYLDNKRVDCIKIDVEGAEIPVLEGMQNMFSEGAVDMMIIEFCPGIMQNAGFDPLHLFDMIPDDFSVKVIESEFRKTAGNGKISSKADLEDLQNRMLEKGKFLNCNLLCERK